jgi:two-component system sensor histidine kinase UhpB
VAAALRHLGAALDSAEAQRQRLSQQVLTLQDDERARLAHELHDEFGQRLTALRVDAAWLGRQVADQPALKAVVDGMSLQCEQVQQDIRALLARLQPFGPLNDQTSGGETLARGVALLHALVASWQAGGRDRTAACRLELDWVDAAGTAQPWPEGEAAEALCLPRALWLTLYRISQEALTNVARHAQAGQAVLALRCTGGRRPGDALRIDWQAWDDGIGLPDPAAAMPRGNGLAGLQQRVWAQGGDWHASAWQPGSQRPGLRLEARFCSRLQRAG